MAKVLLKVSFPKERRFAFLYVVISAVAVTCVMSYSAIAGLLWWQSLLLLTGGLIGAWATLFSFLEVRRLTLDPKSAGEALRDEEDPYAARTVVVAPPTGEPYPHHEDFPESAGFDQGQLTSQLAAETPFIERFLSRRRSEKQLAAR